MVSCGVIEVDSTNAFVRPLGAGVMEFDRLPSRGDCIEHLENGTPTYYEVEQVIHRPDREDRRPLIAVFLPSASPMSIPSTWSQGGV